MDACGMKIASGWARAEEWSEQRKRWQTATEKVGCCNLRTDECEALGHAQERMLLNLSGVHDSCDLPSSEPTPCDDSLVGLEKTNWHAARW